MSDTLASSAITDHPFMGPSGRPWGLCVYEVRRGGEHPHRGPCNMAQSAHRETITTYVTDAPKATG